MISLKVLVTGVIYKAEDFYILTVEPSTAGTYSKERKLVCKGRIFGIQGVVSGVPLELFGKWTSHPKFGKQFDFNGWGPWASSDVGVENFLRHCLGILGENKIFDLVDAFGKDTFRILSEEPLRLLEVSSFDSATADHLIRTWTEAITSSELSSLLADHDVTSEQMKSLFNAFGSESRKIISENPYSLMEVDGFDFSKVDEIAESRGISRSDPRRFEGAVLWVLREASKEGHLCIRRGDLAMNLRESLKEEASSFGSLDLAKDLMDATARLESKGKVFVDPEVGVYLPTLFNFERRSAECLIRFRTPIDLGVDLKEFLDTYENTHQIKLSEAQQDAVEKLVNNRVLVLTGGPGTGKCVRADTLVSGTLGFKEIGSYLPEVTREGQTHSVEKLIDTSQGTLPTEYIYDGGCTSTISITTASGFFLEGTPEHPVKVLRNGDFRWVTLSELAQGDTLILVRGPGSYSFGSLVRLPSPEYRHYRETHFRPLTYITNELASILGYITSEGSVISNNSWQISAYDEKIISELVKNFRDALGFKVCSHFDPRCAKNVGVRIHSSAIIRWFRLLGVEPEYADYKSIPSCILQSTQEIIVHYLRSLFEGDGSVDTSRFSIEYVTSSEKLSCQLQVVLLSLGVVATRYECIRGGKPYFRLGIYGEDYDIFQEGVGFQFTHLPKRTRKSNTNKHLIPEIHGLIHQLIQSKTLPRGFHSKFKRYAKGTGPNSRSPSRSMLIQLLSYFPESALKKRLQELASNKWFYDQVSRIEPSRSLVVDFGVPVVHEFISNGFISHNTTIIKTFVELFQKAGVGFRLMAPTGIAAKRVAMVTGHEAATVHRTFRFNGEEWFFSEWNKYPIGAVIIDEVSMVDQELFFRVVSSLEDGTILVLVGDDAQLPSVGPGSVLRDLIRCPAIPTVRLTQIFRQAQQSEIVVNSHRINRGESILTGDDNSDFRFVSLDDSRIMDLVLKMAEKLKAREANFQILSPKYDGVVGVTNLNESLREVLNPPGPGKMEVSFGKLHFRVGDRLMVIKNDYKLGVYNGDMGKLVEIHSDLLRVRVHGIGEGGLDANVDIPRGDVIQKLRLAYAITVHRCQGSEFDTIILPMVKEHGRMLQRNLFYTAITRAKKRVWVLGDRGAVQRAIDNDKVIARNTGFVKAIMKTIKPGVVE
jgi:ATP-dependent exoDNAse (exonuclease V) alpha subunit/intein/homing endonuclease